MIRIRGVLSTLLQHRTCSPRHPNILALQKHCKLLTLDSSFNSKRKCRRSKKPRRVFSVIVFHTFQPNTTCERSAAGLQRCDYHSGVVHAKFQQLSFVLRRVRLNSFGYLIKIRSSTAVWTFVGTYSLNSSRKENFEFID